MVKIIISGLVVAFSLVGCSENVKEVKELKKKVDKELITKVIKQIQEDFEIGDIDLLGSSIENQGQAQPIIVVDKSDVFVGKNKNNAVTIPGL